MKVIFRVDASIQIGNGHVMRCLTLAGALKNEGAHCTFICREHSGNMLALIQSKGHGVVALPIKETNTSFSNQQPRQEYLSWLGATPDEDAAQTIAAIQSLTIDKPAWLIVDHYALDKDWEDQLRPYCQKIMVIDDLADRQHDCDLLLDQTFGRDDQDYQTLVPEYCTILTGSYYALLRPEFAQWREYSLQRRQQPQLKQLLIILGGVDKDNVTGQVLTALANSQLPKDCHITIVMGEHAPCLESIESQAKQLPWSTEVRVNVKNMAELMANSDLCIGAAGSTTWERCCLGLPTVTLITAENQKTIALNLLKENISIVINNANQLSDILNHNIISKFNHYIETTKKISDGLGVNKIIITILEKNITVLVDNDSWILPFAEKLIQEIHTIGYKVELARNHDEIKNGWINFMLSCTKITPSSVLARNRHNLVVHESNLPKGKGFAPMSWQILEGNNEIPICLLEASDEVDSGDIWIRDIIKLSGTELHDEWRQLQGEKTIDLCLKAIAEYQNITPIKQQGKSTLYRRRTPKDSELDIKESIEQQFNLIRISDNQTYPLFFFFRNKKYIINIYQGEI